LAILNACREAGIAVGTDGDDLTMIFPRGVAANIRGVFIKAVRDRSERVRNYILVENNRHDEINWTHYQ
jgi:hypothetical protein